MFPKIICQNCFRKLSSKATVLQSNCSSILLQNYKIILQNYYQNRVPKKRTKIPKLLREAASKLVRKIVQGCSCSAKLYPGTVPPKVILQSGSRKLRHKIATESCSPKLFIKLPPKSSSQKCCSSKQLFCKIVRKLAKVAPKVAPPCGSPQLLPKASPQSCSPKLRFFKAAVRSCRAKLLLKAAPQSCSCFPKLLHKAVSQSRSPKLLSKAAPNSCSPRLLKLPPKIVSENYFPNCFLKLLPKAVVLESNCFNCSSMLLQSRKVAPHSCSQKLLSKVATESSVPKKLPKTARTG